MNTNRFLDQKVFNVSRNLFGVEYPEEKSLKEGVQHADTIEKLTINENDTRIFAVYPAIIDEAFAQTMDNYRKFVALKNFMYKEENYNIQHYNNSVIAYKKTNKNTLNEVQIQFSELFIKNKKSLSPIDYNIEVEKFNTQYGLLVRKKKIATIKPMAELVFQNFIFIYNQQLMKKNQRYMSCNITTKTPLEPFKVNAWRVTQLKRNGIASLTLCKKTILNHRKRLEAFGVFVDYKFINSSQAVEVHINPEILVVKDIFNSKIAVTENQHVNSTSGKIVPNDNDIFTRTFIKEIKKERKVKNFSDDKEFAPLTTFVFSFTGTPTRIKQSNQVAGAEIENSTITALQPTNLGKDIEKTILDTIVPDSVLAKQLENKDFSNYKPIDIRILNKIAYSGTLTRDEFFEIVMIDFFKSLQKNIYQNSPVYFGSWYNAIKLFRLQRWNLFTGDKFQPANLVAEITQYRWRIQWARNWYRKNSAISPLFPNQYLDVTRQTRKEVGFEYTKSKWIDQQKENEKYNLAEKNQIIIAKKRGLEINYNKKCEVQLNRFFKNKITLTQLYNYIENNLPANFIKKLPEMIEKKLLKINQKTIVIESKIQTEYNAFEF